MNFSIVIPTYNRKTTLRQTLAALATQDYADYEIIVVDDGSTDGTGEMIAAEFPRVRYIRQENRGPAAARNRGIAIAIGEIVAFTDDDCLPPRDWLMRLADGYARYPQVAGVGGFLHAPPDILAWNALARYERYVARGVYHAGDAEYLGEFECPAGGTNNMSYRRKVLERVGGFDETFPHAAGEDADLKWRVCALGARLLYVPCAVVHLQNYSWREFRAQQIRHGRGALYFERKYRRAPSRLRLALRWLKRTVMLARDSFRIGPMLAWIHMRAGWYECWGQWNELERL